MHWVGFEPIIRMFDTVLYRAALPVGLQRCNFCRYEIALIGINSDTSESSNISVVKTYVVWQSSETHHGESAAYLIDEYHCGRLQSTPLGKLHRCHRLGHPSKQFWNWFCGMAFRAAVVLHLMSSMSSKCLPFNISFFIGNRKTALGARIGIGCSITVICSLAKISLQTVQCEQVLWDHFCTPLLHVKIFSVRKWTEFFSTYYRVLTMVYNTQRYWVFGLCPSSGFFLNKNEKTRRFGNWICFRPQVREDTYSVGSLRKS
jgi:hypothetical protein